MTDRRAAAVVAGALLAGIGALLLAGCDTSAPVKHQLRAYHVAERVMRVVVDGRFGDITITGGDYRAVVVTERLSFTRSPPPTTHTTIAGTLTLVNDCPAQQTCGVDYDIRVPRSVTVQVSADAGAIHLYGLAGQVTAATSVGDIVMAALSGPVQATGHSGSIIGHDLSSARAVLKSSAGKIDATFTSAPSIVTATMQEGPVTLHLPGQARYAISATTTAGKIVVTVPRGAVASHAVTAATSTGNVTVAPIS